MADFDLAPWTALHTDALEVALDAFLSPDALCADGPVRPLGLVDAMRYAAMDGGKRLRPLLVIAAFEAAVGRPLTAQDGVVVRAACAVELIHAYSLVHDDMPCMDDDVLRRGKPTVHVQFGEAGALLAGDALQTLAFALLTPEDESIAPALQGRLCGLLARASGCAGMAGGQAIDLDHVGKALTEEALRHMHRCKTGALLECSVRMGAVCGGADAHAQAQLAEFGRALGLAFQVVDDVLDVSADSVTLGKTAGKDAQNDKPTFVSLMGLAQSRQYAQQLCEQAEQALARAGLADTSALSALARRVVQRSH
jgi:farnesyl diphosphate synthase